MTNEPIKVLHLIDSGLPSGINSFVLELLRALDRSRFQIDVCAFSDKGPLLREMRDLRANVAVLNHHGVVDWSATWEYARHIRSGGYQIVHLHHGARVHRCVARLLGCRVVSHAHGTPEAWAGRQASPQFVRDIQVGYSACSDAIVACAQSVADAFTKVLPGVADKISVIPNGIDLTRWQPVSTEAIAAGRRQAGLPQDAVIIGFAGRLVALKRVDRVIDAMTHLSGKHNLCLVILGDGPLRNQLEERAQSLGSRCRFLGWAKSSDWLPLIDVLALPSETEGLPMVILEAMACGKPVVASNVGGIPELVSNGNTGILIPDSYQFQESLESALDSLIAHEDIRSRMGVAGRFEVERRFDARVIGSSIENLYLTLTNNRH